jgi:hypothetical protein
VDALFDYLTSQQERTADEVRALLLRDYVASGARASPACLRSVMPRPPAPVQRENTKPLAERQGRHA